jgi:5-bromo-4-chloroindolyl phosphate hydrolysis protein
MPANAKEAS